MTTSSGQREDWGSLLRLLPRGPIPGIMSGGDQTKQQGERGEVKERGEKAEPKVNPHPLTGGEDPSHPAGPD